MTDKCKCLVFTKPSYISFKKSCMDKISPDMLSLLLFRSNPIQLTVLCSRLSPLENTLSAFVLVPGTQVLPGRLASVKDSSFLALHQSREFLSASKGRFGDGLVMFGELKKKNQRESQVEV